jgi:hypothetical protein
MLMKNLVGFGYIDVNIKFSTVFEKVKGDLNPK